jgi:hypothetical protein
VDEVPRIAFKARFTHASYFSYGVFLLSVHPACDDDLDNDGDGLYDYPDDPGCEHAASKAEDPACQDGHDNEGDGLIDYDGGASLDQNPVDGHVDFEFNALVPAVTAPDPNCFVSWKKREQGYSPCGLGAELALLLPPLMWLSRRRGRSN